MFSKSTELFTLECPPWPEFVEASYRQFKDNEKHINRLFDEFVLIFMLKNTLYFSENNKDITVKAGQWYIQLPGLKQKGKIGSPKPFYFYLHFKAKAYPSKNNLKSSFKANTISSGSINRLYLPTRGVFERKLFDPLFFELNELIKKPTADILKRQSIFLNILNNLLPSTNLPLSHSHNLAIKLADFLSMNYMNSITYQDLSKTFSYSEDYLARILKKYYGMTPKRYIDQLRLKRAKRLLLNTDMNLSSIAERVGYGELSIFYKAFKKQMKLPPGRWRSIRRRI